MIYINKNNLKNSGGSEKFGAKRSKRIERSICSRYTRKTKEKIKNSEKEFKSNL